MGGGLWQRASVSPLPVSPGLGGLFCPLLPRGGGLSSGEDPGDGPPSPSRARSFSRELCRQKQNMIQRLAWSQQEERWGGGCYTQELLF